MGFLEDFGLRLKDAMLSAGGAINRYTDDVGTAFSPGALADVPGWMSENFNKYGQRTADYHANLTKAFQDLQTGNKPDLGPLIQDAISVNPIMAGTWGPIRSPAQKQAVRALWRADPEAVQAIATDPRQLNVDIPGDVSFKGAREAYQHGAMPETALAYYRQPTETIKVAPATMKGQVYFPEKFDYNLLSKGLEPITQKETMVPAPDMAHLPDTMLHESQHFLNVPRLYSKYGPKSDEETYQMIDALVPFLSSHGRKAIYDSIEKSRLPSTGLDEALAYLSGKTTRAPGPMGDAGALMHEVLKVRPGLEQGSTRGVQLNPETIDQVAAKATAMYPPPDPFASLRRMLSDIGKKPISGWKDKPMLGPSLSPEELAMYEKGSRAGRTSINPTDIARTQSGETLPPLGSAFPDIPRPVSSPGGLDFFENLKAKLGLSDNPMDPTNRYATFSGQGKVTGGDKPITYNRFQGTLDEKQGKELFEKLFKEFQDYQPADAKRAVRTGIVDLMGAAPPGPETKDAFIKEIMDQTAQSLGLVEGRINSINNAPGEPGLPGMIERRPRGPSGQGAWVGPRHSGRLVESTRGIPFGLTPPTFLREVLSHHLGDELHRMRSDRLNAQELAATLDPVIRRGMMESVVSEAEQAGHGPFTESRRRLAQLEDFVNTVFGRK